MSNPSGVPIFEFFAAFALPLFVRRLLLVLVYSLLTWGVMMIQDALAEAGVEVGG